MSGQVTVEVLVVVQRIGSKEDTETKSSGWCKATTAEVSRLHVAVGM